MRRPRSLFPLLSFQLGFSGIPENDEKTSKSYLGESSRRPPFLLFLMKGVTQQDSSRFSEPCKTVQFRSNRQVVGSYIRILELDGSVSSKISSLTGAKGSVCRVGRNGTHVPRRLTKRRYARSTFVLAYREPCDPIRRFRACPYEFSVPAKFSAACRDPLFFSEFSCQPDGSRNLGVRGYKGIKPTAHIAAALLCAGMRLFSWLPDSLSCWGYQPLPPHRTCCGNIALLLPLLQAVVDRGVSRSMACAVGES